jgi:hypothetical protein
MADENTLRTYRADDPYGHDTIPSGARDPAGGNDPLAELARLIGQTDPFADIGRGKPRAAEGRDPSHFAVGAPPSAPDWRRNAAPAYDAPLQSDEHADYAADRRHFPPSTVPRHDHMTQDHLTASPARFAADPYGDPHDQLAVQDRYDEDDRLDHAHAGELYAAEPEHDPYYADDAPMGQQDEEIYDDPPNPRRRGGLLTVATLIACAMFGTAGAYAYRMYYVGAVPANPPVIVADKTPAKVVPPSDTQSGKAIQDRVGEQASNERVISHEEQPMQLSSGARSSPRVVLPAPVTPMPNTSVAFPPPPMTQSTLAPNSASQGVPRTAAGGEPKRVRTVIIRPDGADETGKSVGGIGSSGSSPSRSAAVQSRGPLSLNPGAEAPAARSAPATRLASAPSNGGSGGYMVQISSQRSEADAHASFRAMQAKYRSVLGGHDGIVRRADLGSKGTYYRALVGPFASAGEAGHLCSQLKAAGGQCIIQRN